jgi:hypothetical protein
MNKNKEIIYQNLRSKKGTNLLIELKKSVMKLLLTIKENKKSIIEISYDYQNIIYSISLNYGKVFNIDFELDRNLFKDLTLSIENIISKSIFNKIMNKLISEEKGNFDELIKLYNSFITLDNLGIVTNINLYELNEKVEFFNNIFTLKNAYEKLEYILFLVNYLKINYPKENIPLIISYIIISSDFINLKEHFYFCKYFHFKMYTSSEEEYSLLLFEEAIKIIENFNTNHDMLTLTDEEFKNYCEEYNKRKIILKLENLSIKNKKEDNKNDININLLIDMLNKIRSIGNNIEFNNEKNDNNYKDSPILSIQIKQLYNKYFQNNKSFQQMSYSEIEQLYNDFKIILKLIESNNNND